MLEEALTPSQEKISVALEKSKLRRRLSSRGPLSRRPLLSVWLGVHMAAFSVKNYSRVSCRQMFGSFCQFIQDVVTRKRSGCGYFRKCGRCGFYDPTNDTRQRGECVCPACSSLLRQQRGYSSSRGNDFCCIWVTARS